MLTQKNLTWLCIAVVASFFLATFFYKLDYTALQSYDEAWYAAVARNILRTHNPFLLQFNGEVYTDHPPLGFWLMSLPIFILGSNEFSARFVSAFLGALTLLVVYLIGKEMKSRVVGVSGLLIVWSSLWFMLRARSGNLDVPFVFWEVLTVFCLLKIKKDARFFLFAALSFACLLMTKTMVGFGLLPVVILFTVHHRRTITRHIALKSLCVMLMMILPWYLYNQFLNPNFLHHHFFDVGVRGKENLFAVAALRQNLLYLQITIGKWNKLFWLALVSSCAVWYKAKKTRFLLMTLWLWLLGFGAPFLLSAKTEIWHLLPLVPPIALLIGFVFEEARELIQTKKNLFFWLPVALISLLAFYQFHQFANLLYPSEKVLSPEKDIAQKAQAHGTIFLMDTFYPAAVYYSQQSVDPFYWQEQAYPKMVASLQKREGHVFLINRATEQQLGRDHVSYSMLERNNQYLLIQ